MLATVLHAARRRAHSAASTEPRRSEADRRRASGCRPPASAGRTCGPTAGCSRWTAPRTWATNTAAWSSRSASEVRTVKPGQFVVGSFCISDNTCPHCRFGFPSSCEQREFMTRGAGAIRARAAGRRNAGRHRRSARRRADPQPPGNVGRAGHRLVRGGCGKGAAGLDGGRRRRRRRGADGGAVGQADGGRAHHRDEPAQEPPGARAGVWCDRHRLGTRRSGRRAHQGIDQRDRRRCGAGMRRHAGIDDRRRSSAPDRAR